MKIQTKFITYLFPVIIIGFILFAGLALYIMRQNVMEEVKGNLVNITSSQQYMINYFIEDYQEKFDVVALSREVKTAIADYHQQPSAENFETLEAKLISKKDQLGKFVKDITVIDEKNTIIASLDRKRVGTQYHEYTAENFPKVATINFLIWEEGEFINDIVGPIVLDGKWIANLDVKLYKDYMLGGLFYFPGLGKTGKTILLKQNSGGSFTRLEMFKSSQDKTDHEAIVISEASIPSEGNYFTQIINMRDGEVKQYVNYHGIPCIGLINTIKDSDWKVLTGIYTSEAFSILYQIRNYTLIGLTIVLLVTFGVVLMVTASITKPITYLTQAIQNYKKTRQWQAPTSIKEGGEIGLLADALSETIGETQVLTKNLKTQAEQDIITGLPNRRYFFEAITELLNNADPSKDRFAVFYIVLEGMKAIHETLGREVGDILLKEAAERLHNFSDKNTLLSRFDGEEFASIVHDYQGEDELFAKASILLNLFIQPFLLEGQVHRLNLNIGISQYPGDGTTINELLKNADIAMYTAKKQKPDSYQLYTKEISDSFHRMQWLKIELIPAIRAKQFEMVYQPQVDNVSHKIIGVESLIRWKHPTEGYIRPDEFIEVAEKNQLIHPITEIAISKSFEDFNQLKQAGIVLDKMAINISVQDFEQSDLPKYLLERASYFKIPIPHIMLEITESLFMANPLWIVSVMAQLKSLGFMIGLDDFGKGYSSLSSLATLPIDLLKIDKAFVDDLMQENTKNSRSIVLTIIELAKQLNKKVLAEGVEIEPQVKWLTEHGCHLFQGYYFSKPLSLKELMDFYKSW